MVKSVKNFFFIFFEHYQYFCRNGALSNSTNTIHFKFSFTLSAGSLLRPYISPKNYWILTHHEIFQAYYYGDAMKIDKNTRDRFKDQPYYGACEGTNN